MDERELTRLTSEVAVANANLIHYIMAHGAGVPNGATTTKKKSASAPKRAAPEAPEDPVEEEASAPAPAAPAAPFVCERHRVFGAGEKCPTDSRSGPYKSQTQAPNSRAQGAQIKKMSLCKDCRKWWEKNKPPSAPKAEGEASASKKQKKAAAVVAPPPPKKAQSQHSEEEEEDADLNEQEQFEDELEEEEEPQAEFE